VTEPYYSDDLVTLYHGDCRELLPDITADVLVTDPPYGVGMDSFDDSLGAAITGVNLAPGSRAAVFMSPRTVFDFTAGLNDWKPQRLLWMHKAADMAAPWRGWCMNSEAIVILAKPKAKWQKPIDYRSDVYRVGPWERAGHPCGKPLEVVTDLVRRLTFPHEVVLDPFAGSGTTLRAAKDLGIKAVGVEIDERYCELTASRLAQDVLDLNDVA
jgi:site-specific DNA-methyltransferase (adenine-specific)